jgi:hypothetical protein
VIPPIARLLAGAFALGCAVTACGSDRPAATPDELAVCRAVQGIVDNVIDGGGDGDEDRNVPALVALDELGDAVAATGNETMASQGTILFDTIYQQVDPGALTMTETIELGQQVGIQSARALDGIIAECDEVGAPIERLDLVPVDEQGVDAVTPAPSAP